MSIFEYVTAVLLLILGLGITQLLGDLVDAFRRRQSSRLHWVPLAWSGMVFALQIQFLWAVFELNLLQTSWSAQEFLVMLLLALLLFVAGALVVPNADDEEGEDAWAQFRQDGRWALAVLGVYFLAGFFANTQFFNTGPWEPINLLALLMVLIICITVFTNSRRITAITTIISAGVLLVSIILASPASYSLDPQPNAKPGNEGIALQSFKQTLVVSV